MRSQLVQLGYDVPQGDYSFKEPKRTDGQRTGAEQGRQSDAHNGTRFSSSSTTGKQIEANVC